MLYQLPNGKTIYLTLEEFLDLTDQDIQYLMSVNAGHYAPQRNPFVDSSLENTEEEDEGEDEEEECEEDEAYEEDFPDLPDVPPEIREDISE